MVLKHFAFKNPFAFLNIEEYELYLSKAVKVIEKIKDLLFMWVIFINKLL